MKVERYIVGDSPSRGYGLLGCSENFPAENLPWLNHGAAIAERARIEAKDVKSGNGGLVAHVWELETGSYGVPVVINTECFSGGRTHSFSEYMKCETENVAELPLGKLITAANSDTTMLNEETFLQLSGSDKSLEPGDWAVESARAGEWDGKFPDAEWLSALLFHYWMAASTRAFSDDMPEPVHVFLGQHDEADNDRDWVGIIDSAQKFFAGVIDQKLPKQVRNIASMAAGTNCGDDLGYLYTALQFDIGLNHPEDGSFSLKSGRIPSNAHLNDAQHDFIHGVLHNGAPEVVTRMLENYRLLSGQTSADASDTPFMADGRIWYALYCLERCISEGHAFVEKAGLRVSSQKDCSDARAYYQLIESLRSMLRSHPEITENSGHDMTDQLLESLELPLYNLMLKDMAENGQNQGRRSFLQSKREMEAFHRDLLYRASEKKYPQMIRLVCEDQRCAGEKPNYIRACIAVQVRSTEADRRNAELLTALLTNVFHDLIEKDCQKVEKIESPYINFLGSEEFADHWVLRTEQSRRAIADFIRGEWSDSRHFFLLYRIAKKYIGPRELLLTALKQLDNNMQQKASSLAQQQEEAMPAQQKEEVLPTQQRNVVMDALRVVKDNAGGELQPELNAALNRFYVSAFRKYGSQMEQLNDYVQLFGGDTSVALYTVFDEEAKQCSSITAEEAKAFFAAMAKSEEGKYLQRKEVASSYAAMLRGHAQQMLDEWKKAPDDKPLPIDWLSGMLKDMPVQIDTVPMLLDLLNAGKECRTLSVDEAKLAFDVLYKKDQDGKNLQSKEVASSYASMLRSHAQQMLDEWKKAPDAKSMPTDWISSMIGAASIQIDTVPMLLDLLNTGKECRALPVDEAKKAFDILCKEGQTNEGITKAFSDLLDAICDDQLEKKEFPVQQISALLEVFPFKDRIDTSSILCRMFTAAADLPERMISDTARSAFKQLGPLAKSMNDAVQSAYQKMLVAQEKKALDKEEPEYTVTNWLAQMHDASSAYFVLDTSEELKLLFEKWAKRIAPDETRAAFAALSEHASELSTSIKSKYTSMLQANLQNHESASIADTFNWLCEMISSTPDSYVQDSSWLNDLHTSAIRLLCTKAASVERSELDTVKKWLDSQQVDDSGYQRIQDYCNRQLQSTPSDAEPASLFLQYFREKGISSNMSALKEYVKTRAAEDMHRELESSSVKNFGDTVSTYQKQIERLGFSAEELYNAVEKDVHVTLEHISEENDNISFLIEETEKIPRGPFQNAWNEMVKFKISSQQEELFNQQESLKNLLDLKKNTLKYGVMRPSVKRAYEIIDMYQNMLSTLIEQDEYEAVSSVGNDVRRLESALHDTDEKRNETGEITAHEVRKNLCRCLKKAYQDTDLAHKSFRHMIAANMLWATLSEKENGKLNWTQLRQRVIPDNLLGSAVKKPYSAKNLPVLQRLLALFDAVSRMEQSSTSKGWIEQMNQGLNDSLYKKYTAALRRNKKACERYQLYFDNTGHLFSQINPLKEES